MNRLIFSLILFLVSFLPSQVFGFDLSDGLTPADAEFDSTSIFTNAPTIRDLNPTDLSDYLGAQLSQEGGGDAYGQFLDSLYLKLREYDADYVTDANTGQRTKVDHSAEESYINSILNKFEEANQYLSEDQQQIFTGSKEAHENLSVDRDAEGSPIQDLDPFFDAIQQPEQNNNRRGEYKSLTGIENTSGLGGSSVIGQLYSGDVPLFKFIATIFYFGLIVAIALAVLMIIRGGYLYMLSGDSGSKKDEGKKRIQAAVGGLLLALGSLLILQTINPKILEFDFSFERIDLPNSGGSGPSVPSGPSAPSETGDVYDDTYEDNSGRSSDVYGEGAEITQKFQENGITVNSPQRTSVSGMRESTVNGLIEMKNGSGVDGLVITGGTEGGHASGTYSHGNGYKIDIGANSNSGERWNKFDGYMKKVINNNNPAQNTTYRGTLPSGQKVEARLEPKSALHWDIKFLPKE